MPPKKDKVYKVKIIKGKRGGRGNANAKPKEKSGQKQKQRQVVNVQVGSSGGGSGGFIPSIDYSLLSNLLRPAATVDVPIRAATPMMEPLPARAAEEPTLAESKARARKAGESDEAYNLRIVRYEQQLANKAQKNREQTEARQREKVLGKLPQAEAFASPFVGEADIFGEK